MKTECLISFDMLNWIKYTLDHLAEFIERGLSLDGDLIERAPDLYKWEGKWNFLLWMGKRLKYHD
jgi:hypothetical protein